MGIRGLSLIFLFVLIMPLLIAEDTYSNCKIYGNCKTLPTLGTTNINNSYTNITQNFNNNTYNITNNITTPMDYTNIVLTNKSSTINGNITLQTTLGDFPKNSFYGYPMTGSLGSGIVWANGTNSYAEVNISCVGLACSYDAFTVRLVNTTGVEKYCNIQAGTIIATDDTHNVFYIDNNCAVQKTTIQTYIQTPISPGGIADFGNVIMETGSPYNPNGIGTENKRIIKLRKLLLQSTGKHLSIINGGFQFKKNAFPQFNITAGQYVYLMDIVSTTAQETGVDNLEIIYHTGAGTWAESDQKGLNLTTCDTATGIEACPNPTKYRRAFIFNIGYNESTDYTQLHQLLPLSSISYTTVADCLDTVNNPITYTLPTYYQYGAVPLFAYCGRGGDSAWVDTNLISIKETGGSGGGGTSDITGLVPYTGATTNVDLDGKNISASWFKGLFNWTVIGNWFGWDGATLSFNETKLNQTIVSEGVRVGFNSTYNSSYVPYTGATSNVNLGIYSLNATNANATNFYFNKNTGSLWSANKENGLTLHTLNYAKLQAYTQLELQSYATASKIVFRPQNTVKSFMNLTGFYVNQSLDVIAGNNLTVNGRVGIGTTNPAYPLDVGSNVSGISIYAQGNISSAGYITRTDVYDTSKGSALDQIKDASKYKDLDGTINHSVFGYSAVSYDKQVIDKVTNYTLTHLECINETSGEIGEEITKETCKSVETVYQNITYKTIKEEGVSLDKEISLIKQAVYELKNIVNNLIIRITGVESKIITLEIENTRMKDCAKEIDYKTYQECILK